MEIHSKCKMELIYRCCLTAAGGEPASVFNALREAGANFAVLIENSLIVQRERKAERDQLTRVLFMIIGDCEDATEAMLIN